MDLQLGAIIHWWPHFACLWIGVGLHVKNVQLQFIEAYLKGGNVFELGSVCPRFCFHYGSWFGTWFLPLLFHQEISFSNQQATPDWIKSSLIKLYWAWHTSTKKNFLEWILWQAASVIVWLCFMDCVAIMKLRVKWFWTPQILCVGVFEHNTDNCLLSLLSIGLEIFRYIA